MPRIAAIGSLLLISSALIAHPGHGASGFLAGFAHPWSGIDHLIAMLAVGLLAARLRAWWLLPLAFMGGMATGGLLAALGCVMPMVEPAILVSLLLLGTVLALAQPPRQLLAAVLVATLALPHGFAHVVEAGGSLSVYAGGFLLATLLLQAFGVLVGTL